MEWKSQHFEVRNMCLKNNIINKLLFEDMIATLLPTSIYILN